MRLFPFTKKMSVSTQIILSLVALLVLGAIGYYCWTFFSIILRIERDRKEFNSLTDTRDLPDRIAGWADEYIAKRPNVRLTVGVLQKGKRWVNAYGPGRPSVADTPNGKVLYEIGSITKVFNALILARMAIDGQLALDDPISSFLPAEVNLPAKVKGITLKQLALHTSGLPRLPDNFDAVARDDSNPYVKYTTKELYEYLSVAKLSSEPGATSDYTNLGAGLLGHALCLKSGASFENLVKTRIADPVKMPDTVLTFTAEQQKRLIDGHEPGGKITSHWDFDVLAPAGAIRSTADDMLVFLKAHLEAKEDDPLGKAMRLALDKHYDGGAMGQDMGLGWIRQQDMSSPLHVHWHNGGTGGFVSFAGLNRDNSVAVIVLSNYGDAMSGDDYVDWLGLKILRTSTKVSLE